MKVTLSETDAKALTHPEYAPHGVECEAEYRHVTMGEIYYEKEIERPQSEMRGKYLVVTPRKPSLAQLVKDSGWRCDVVGAIELQIDLRNKRAWARSKVWDVELRGPFLSQLPDKDPVNGHELHIIHLDADGYPIVEGGDQQ